MSTIDTVLWLIALGYSQEEACKAAGISEGGFLGWQDMMTERRKGGKELDDLIQERVESQDPTTH